MIKLILIVVLILPYSAFSFWKPESELMKAETFNFMIQNENGQYLTSPSSAKLSSKCFGFTGTCILEEVGLKLELTFSGYQIKLPFLKITDGIDLQLRANYFGKRILTISKIDGTKLASFTDKLWLKSEYFELGQMIFFDTENKILYISAREGFNGIQEQGYPIKY